MMRVPWNIPCEANNRRGRIKHAFLENGILNTAAEDRAGAWLTGSDDELITRQFPGYISWAEKLAEEMVEGFSPSQLVDKLSPLQNLSHEIRTKIKEAVHAVYLEETEIVALAREFKQEVKDFVPVCNSFIKTWQETERIEGNKPIIREPWRRLQKHAESLYAVVIKLPQGVVLP